MLIDYNTAFFAHSFVALIAQEMDRPTRQQTMRLTWVSFSAIAVISYLVPLVGYLLFSGVEHLENIFYHLNPDNPEVLVGRIAVLVISLVSTAFYGYHMAGIVAGMIIPGTGTHGVSGFCANVALGFVAIWLNSMEQKWTNFMYDLGSVAFTLLAFVLPPVFYLRQFQFRYVTWGVVAVIVLALGLMMLVLGIVWIVRRITEKS
jgi:hypothetical protein